MINFKGSMPAPLYEHGNVNVEGKVYSIQHREWLESFKSWQYTLTVPETATFIHLLEDDLTRKME